MRKYLASGTLAVSALVAGLLTAAPAFADSSAANSPKPTQIAGAQTTPTEEPEPTYAELSFAHPVSLESATTVTQALGLEVQGYHIESDSIVGDYWPDAGLTVDEFLANVAKATATAPEIVSAYVLAEEVDASSEAQRGASTPLGADLPAFDAPDADPSLAVPPERSSKEDDGGEASRASKTWQPNDAQVMIQGAGTTLSISAKYAWYGLDPFASPLSMANHWGMEFQFDFYTHMRPNLGIDYPIGYGYRPACGTTELNYKNWAAASTRPYSWFGWVISGPDYVAAPGSLGLYGDFNDLSDPCNVSTIAVGMAQPWAMPTSYGDNYLDLYLYPLKGDDAQSTVGAIVQPVSRQWCEDHSSMPLMDCMGVTPGPYPGPGPSLSRMVLNNANNRKAPNLCWNSSDFGTVAANVWSC